ncbi:MAG: hypothetical protein WB508_07425 [Aeromicrobium sp.]|uniref:hypothetical protein n=1 Tax=Aeromicrobium sp. TaxID=1871063 RepID=UPI003C64A9EA
MLSLRTGPALALGLALLAGCGASSESTRPDQAGTAATADPCIEIRAGIDAFNLGDYEETIGHFRKALPLAVDEAKNDDSQKAADLVEAVTYYAELDPEKYPEAARSSADFAKYKAITLGQCVAVEEPGSDEPPPVAT